MEELFEIIDESGKVIGTEKRSIVHKKGLLHKEVDVFVLDKDGKIFVQQRSFQKDIGPGLWDVSAAEHLKPGENFEQAAVRGVKEELGIKTIGLQKIGEITFCCKFGDMIENEMKQVFQCRFKGKIKLQEKEIEQGRWISKEDLLKEMAYNEEIFSKWFLLNRKFFSQL